MADKIEAHMEDVYAYGLKCMTAKSPSDTAEAVARVEASARALAQGEPGEAVFQIHTNDGWKDCTEAQFDNCPEWHRRKLYLSPTASAPAAEREPEPLSDDLCVRLLEAKQPTPRIMSRDEFLVRNAWRACCEVNGIGTKEPTNG